MGNCSGRNIQLNPGSVLDRVISQASNDDDCLLYKLANYKKGGELVDAYNIGGAGEVEKLIREQFGILMYKNGDGQIISRTEYLRWKFRNIKQVVIPVEATGPTDPLGKWDDHEACWQMQYRGSLGETLLHLLIICDTKLHTRLARILLKCYPKLAVDVFEGEEYLGASALHLAIAYTNNELVHLLVEAGAKVDQRATGSFFLPRDQQRLRPSKQTDYEGLAYLGEYPLAWAACVGNESVYNLLLDKDAHPDWQDSFGNMILHMVVVTDQLGMYGYALRHPKIIASNAIMNNQGLTPLTLACRLGRASVFREMLELSCREFWRYSNVTCSAYPLNALDTIAPDGRTNWNSALFMILAGRKEEHLDMLDGGIIQRLLEEKWKTFAQRQFMKRITIAFLHIFALSFAVYLRPRDRKHNLLDYTDAMDLIRLAFEIGTIASCISYVVFQQGEEIKNQGFVSFLKQLPQSPPKLIFLLANFTLLSCIPCRIMGNLDLEEGLLTFSMVGSWFFMMFFAGAVKLTGPFITMIFSMITGDMLTFGIIYMIFLFGFSQAFYYLYKTHPTVNDILFESYPKTWMAMYQMTLGSYSYNDLAFTAYPNVSKVVFIAFMILVPILLLNMLIAMMGNTYSQVIERSEKEWVKQWAKLVVSLERAISQDLARGYLQEYSIKLPGSSGGIELRGVMVIKTKGKTKAKQRKGALTNWKRVGKVTINALKKRGMTGEEMRMLMWGHRTSVCTPQNITPKQGSFEMMDPNLYNHDPNNLNLGLDVAFSEMNLNGGDNITRESGKVNPNPFGCLDDRILDDGTTLSSQYSQGDGANQVIPSNSNEQQNQSPVLLIPTTTTSVAKVKRRNITSGLRPKIIIFSDRKDLINVNFDSDSDEDNFFRDLPSSASQPIQRTKSLRRMSIAGESFMMDSDEGENLCTGFEKEEAKLMKSVCNANGSGGLDNRGFIHDSASSVPRIELPIETVQVKTIKPENDESNNSNQEKEKPQRPKSGAPANATRKDVKVKPENIPEEEKSPTPSSKSKVRSISAKSGKSKIKDVGEDEAFKKSEASTKRERPKTAFEQRTTQDITNMNKLVAWDRPEDDI